MEGSGSITAEEIGLYRVSYSFKSMLSNLPNTFGHLAVSFPMRDWS
jgi:hypothetical protein